MSTQTAELAMSVETLDGILETHFFKGIVPITKEEEDDVRQKIKKENKHKPNEGDVVGVLQPYEKALLVRTMTLRMEIEKSQKGEGNPLRTLFGALSGDQGSVDLLKGLSTKGERVNELREFFWKLVNQRFAEALSGDKVTGLRIDHNFQVLTNIGEESHEQCPFCGGYHD